MSDADTPLEQGGPPLPTRQVMHQWWRDLCFVHWRVAPEQVAPLLPAGTRPDVVDGSAWVGLIPFRMVDAGLLRGPAVPWLGTFLELNVRTYAVDAAGRRGVVFRSLEAQRAAVVAGARLGFGVPYRWASMSLERSPGVEPGAVGEVLRWRSRRLEPRGARSSMTVRVRERIADPDPLAIFLTARFGLHTRWLGRTLWVPNTHGPWPLQRAELLDLDDELVAAAGLPADVVRRPPDSVLYSPGVRTVFGAPVGVG